jgi:hypothetical protein
LALVAGDLGKACSLVLAAARLRLRFAQPLPRLSGVGAIEVSDRRFRKRLAERRHAKSECVPHGVLDHLLSWHFDCHFVGSTPAT